MSGQEWTVIITAIFAGLVLLLNTYLTWKSKQSSEVAASKADTAAFTAVVAANTAAEKSESLEKKLDNNTKITNDAKTLAESTHQKMNGGIDDAISKSLIPLHERLEEHIMTDDQFMREIKQGLAELKLRIK